MTFNPDGASTYRDLLACVLALVDNDQVDHLDALVPQIREALAPAPPTPRTGVCKRYLCGLPAQYDRLCAEHLDERQTPQRQAGGAMTGGPCIVCSTWTSEQRHEGRWAHTVCMWRLGALLAGRTT